MSVQAVKWAMYSAPMLTTETGRPDSTARQVLAVLAEHAGERGERAHPSPVRVAFATGLDERTVERAIRRLERGGLIRRNGIGRNGCTNWDLAMTLTRPESEEDEFKARAEEAKRAESDRRQGRRERNLIASVDVSGTENAGQPSDEPSIECDDPRCVRHGECGCPARRMPDVRHGAPPEPPEEPPGNHQTGGAPPPDPRRPVDPPTSGQRNEQRNLINKGETKPPQNRTTTYAARGTAPVGQPTEPPAETQASGDQPRRETKPRREGRCRHGRNSRARSDGQPRCPECREEPPPQEAEIIQFPLASGGSP